MSTEPLLSVREVSARVHLSQWAIRRAIDDGQLAAYKIRGQLRIEPADLERWLAACRVDRQPSATDNVVPMTPVRKQRTMDLQNFELSA